MTTEQLRELRDLAARATSGPWEYDPQDPPWLIAWDNGTPVPLADVIDEGSGQYLAALSPERIIALVDEVFAYRDTERLQDAVKHLLRGEP